MCTSQNSEVVDGDDRKRLIRSEDPLRSEVLLLNRQRTVQADWGSVRAFLDSLRENVSGLPFSVSLVSDRSIRRYNKRFRGHDEATDVLSFPADGGGQESNYLGDIVISVETALEDAATYDISLEEEIKMLALHGVLHMMGYDHETDQGQMARAERLWGKRFGLAASLTARSRKGRRMPQGVRQ